MKNKSVQNCRFVHHAKFHCIMTTLNRLFKVNLKGGGNWKRAPSLFSLTPKKLWQFQKLWKSRTIFYWLFFDNTNPILEKWIIRQTFYSLGYLKTKNTFETRSQSCFFLFDKSDPCLFDSGVCLPSNKWTNVKRNQTAKKCIRAWINFKTFPEKIITMRPIWESKLRSSTLNKTCQGKQISEKKTFNSCNCMFLHKGEAATSQTRARKWQDSGDLKCTKLKLCLL